MRAASSRCAPATSATARACHEAALASYQRTGFADPTALASYGRLAAVCLLIRRA